MAKDKFTSKLQGFADRVKAEPVQLPVQKVSPVDAPIEPKDEQQLNVWVPKSLLKQLKVKGAQEDKSLKEMVIEALQGYL
jgi:hypothetical protein